MANEYIFNDREVDLSILNFSVQLYTPPSISDFIVDNTCIISSIFNLLKSMYLADNQPETDVNSEFFNLVQISSKGMEVFYPKLSCEGGSVQNRRLIRFFFDIRYLALAYRMKNTSKYLLKAALPSRPISDQEKFFDLCLVWQGMNPQTRVMFQHIEFEQKNWINAFNLSIHIQELLVPVAHSFCPSASITHSPNLLNAISLTKDSLLNWTLIEHANQTKSFRESLLARGPSCKEMHQDGFHCLEIIDGKAVRIPDFRIDLQEVSFHHPLHWFYSHILSYIPKVLNLRGAESIREVVVRQLFECDLKESRQNLDGNDTLSSAQIALHLNAFDRNMLIFDTVIRTAALISQIKAGVWVRNGVSMRSQALHYREMVLRSCNDLDVFLLQYASIALGSEVFLTMLIDRFAICDWFSLGGIRDSIYEATQITTMIQEFLNLVILILTERSNIAALSGSEQLRREIIHLLASNRSGMAYSEIYKEVPETLLELVGEGENEGKAGSKSETFEHLLKSVSTFKFPDSTSGHGLYQLQDQYFSEVDPWFWHYTRNERETVDDILRSKQKEKVNLLIPKLAPLQPSTGFDRLTEMIHSPIFHQILFFTLWNMTKTESDCGSLASLDDMIFSEVIHLLVVAFEITKSQPLHPQHTSFAPEQLLFVMNAVSTKIGIPSNKGESSGTSTLLELVLGLVDRAKEEDIKQHSRILRHLVGEFESLGGKSAQLVITGWRDKSNWKSNLQIGVIADDSGLSEQEKRKLAAKARQAAIMAQFAKAQESFMANFEDEIEDEEEETPIEVPVDDNDPTFFLQDRISLFPTGNCIVCQEMLDKNAVSNYGMLGLIQKTRLSRKIDFLDKENLQRVMRDDGILDNDTNASDESYESSENITLGVDGNMNGSRLVDQGCFTSSCGHLMHVSCFETYQKSILVRHASQPTRNHPEVLLFKEFLCPLCKSLGNVLLPVIWTERKEFMNRHGCNLSSDVKESNDDFGLINSLNQYINNDRFGSKQYELSTLATLLDEREIPNKIFDTLEKIFQTMADLHPLVSISSVNSLMLSPMPGGLLGDSGRLALIRTMYQSHLFPNLTRIHQDTQSQHHRYSIYYQNKGIDHVWALWDTYYMTVSMTEMISRNSTSQWAHGSNPSPLAKKLVRIGILDRINPNSLQTLSVLAETCLSNIVFEAYSTYAKLLSVSKEFMVALNGSTDSINANSYPPLLLRDGFSHLVHVSFTVIPLYGKNQRDHIFHWIRLFALFEIAHCLTAIIESVMIYSENWMEDLRIREYSELPFLESVNEDDKSQLKRLIEVMTFSLGLGTQVQKILNSLSFPVVSKLCRAALLIYGRKCVLLLNTRFCIVPPGGAVGFGVDISKKANVDYSSIQEESELVRIASYLQIPSFETMLNHSSAFDGMIAHWCSHLKKFEPDYWLNLDLMHHPDNPEPHVNIDQPIALRLTPLPKQLNVLFQESLKIVCTSCQQIPQDPAICLLCGTCVCSQSFCCSDDNYGECNIHMRR